MLNINSHFFKLFQTQLKNPSFKNVYNKLGPPILFDVTLRDGLQTFKQEFYERMFHLEYKKMIYNEIYSEHSQKNIEVGSIVSKHVLPILQDSVELFHYAEKHNKLTNHFLLIPNSKNLDEIIDDLYLKNISLITSVSNSFQKKNTKMDLNRNKNELSKMIQILHENKKDNIDYFIKLYVSCVNECPIEGKLNNDLIVNEILDYNKMRVDTICLSDTCGTLEVKDFKYIVDTCNYFGIPFSKMSLHLHVKNNRIHIVKQIIREALDRRIINFDVSLLESGGCSVTMDEKQLANNLSYDLYYETLIEYINKQID